LEKKDEGNSSTEEKSELMKGGGEQNGTADVIKQTRIDQDNLKKKYPERVKARRTSVHLQGHRGC